jgi:hypothetical protein
MITINQSTITEAQLRKIQVANARSEYYRHLEHLELIDAELDRNMSVLANLLTIRESVHEKMIAEDAKCNKLFKLKK